MTNATNDTDGDYSTSERVVIIAAGTLLSLVTAGGNLLVLLSFRIDKSLQIISNYFLFSLAVADLAIGLISCPFMTLYTVNNRWTLGYGLCQFWLSVDYLMSNASVWNLLLISLDRYFSVTRPLTYRPKRTTGKALTMIASTYILSLVLWPPWIIAWPYIEGRFVLEETECMVQFLKTNRAVTIGTIMAAFYIPVTVMMVLYARVFWVTETRNKTLSKLQGFQKDKRASTAPVKPRKPSDGSLKNETADAPEMTIYQRPRRRPKMLCCKLRRGRSRNKRANDDLEKSWSHVGDESQDDSQLELSDDNLLTTANSAVLHGNNNSAGVADTYTVVIKFPGKHSETGLEVSEPRISVYEPEERSTAEDRLLRKHRTHKDYPGPPRHKASTVTSATVEHAGPEKGRPSRRKGAKKTSDKKQERKAAKTLSAILFAFVLTWAPYSLIICIFAFHQDLIHAKWFTFSYYLCYLNSTINPVLYALCNENFRRTYIRILKCQFRQQKQQYAHQRGMAPYAR